MAGDTVAGDYGMGTSRHVAGDSEKLDRKEGMALASPGNWSERDTQLRNKPYTIIFALFSLIISGCSSYKNAKEMEVDVSYKIENVKAEPISACVFEILREETGGHLYHYSYDTIRKKWFIVAELTTLLLTGSNYHSYSISFQDSGIFTTMEIRSHKTIWGGLLAPSKEIFDWAEKCRAALD